MRKLVIWNLMTLDGYFEGPRAWEIDWHDLVWGKELEQFSLEQARSIGTLLFGRVTYEGMASYWSTAEGEVAEFMNSVPKVVFSTTLERADWKATRLVRDDAAAEVARLKQEPGKDLYIFGSAHLASTLGEKGLIDEVRLGVVPVVLGGGSPLFKASAYRTKLKLLEAKPLGESGCVLLRYEPQCSQKRRSGLAA